MSCEECSKEQEQEHPSVYYYRLGRANLAVIGCRKHVTEMFEILNNERQN